ncbi:MAG: GAP family protein [Anaerolineae bacterium]|nr:GAP family protein [Anaerolineae bacterium]
MTLSLMLSLTGIAVVDSLNPSLFIAQFYLLTTPKPAARISAYIAGVLVVNFFGGLLVLGGVRTVVAEFFSSISPAVLSGGQLVLGVVLVIFGLWYSAVPQPQAEPKKPRSLLPVHTFLLGMVVMVNELSTALPYFLAIERIAQAQIDVATSVGALILYNGIFALPLFGFLALFLAYRSRFTRQIDAINRWIQKWMPRLLKYGALILGLVLIAAAVQMWLG